LAREGFSIRGGITGTGEELRRSTDRILTTHAGSLPRPQHLIDAYRAGQDAGILGLTAAGETPLRESVAEVVARQASCGVDVVNDGEFGKPMTEDSDYGAWATYIYARVSGYELRERTDPGQVMKEIFGRCKDRVDFASFYAAGLDGTAAPRRRARPLPASVGPIKYTGQALIQRDIANFKAALAGQSVADAFMTAAFTGVQIGPNDYYKTRDEQAVALA